MLLTKIQDRLLAKERAQFLRSYWNQWNIRVMVLASLLLQLLLIWFGHKRRRYTGKHPLRLVMLVWLTYMLAEFMATAVLSTLLRRNADLAPRGGLVAFWTPFILWHLGGPYNITAYSLEDNELWLRHFFAMVFQVAEAIYIFIIYGNGVKDRTFKFIACPIFIAGFLKYGERIWALRCASDKELVKSVYPDKELVKSVYPDPKKIQSRGERKMIRTGLYDDGNRYSKYIEANGETNESERILKKAYFAFEVFKPLFFDLPFELSTKFRDPMFYLNESTENAFKMVEIELEFLYDLLFSKLPIQFYKQNGVSLALRIFCFGSAVSSLIAFSLILEPTIPMVDIVVTYLLLGQVIFLDLCTFYLQSRSNWLVRNFTGSELYFLLFSRRQNQPEQGIKVMAQHGLIQHYVKDARIEFWGQILEIFDTNDLIRKFGFTSWSTVHHDLKIVIFSHLKAKRQKCANEDIQFLLEKKGEAVLQDRCGGYLDESWKMETIDFSSRIFIWHIATDLVYYDDLDNLRRKGSSTKIGKSLSDYMMYLVLVRPSMLPKGFNETIHRSIRNKAYLFLPKEGGSRDLKQAMKASASAFLSKPDNGLVIFGATSGSIEIILSEGLKFARNLQDLAKHKGWDVEEKWDLISEVWMEMIIYAASHCSWREHAQQLRHGGELLTHVALLMAHFGLSTQIQEQKDRGEGDNPPPFAIWL